MLFVVMMVGILTLWAAPDAAHAQTVAHDMVGSGSQNLTSYSNPYTGAFTSLADGFQKYQRGGSASIPFAVTDDSLSIFPADELGIIKEGNTDIFFGIVDTTNDDNSGQVNAQWVFDVGGVTPLQLSIDMGAMGNFEASDVFSWTYQFDGGPEMVAFIGSVDESDSFSYTLEGGAIVQLDDPMFVGGTRLTNDLARVTTDLNGTGSSLTLKLSAVTDSGSEAIAFQNIVISIGGGNETPDVLINEVDADTVGSDALEFVELYDGGSGGVALDGLVVVFYNGSNNLSYAAYDLDSFTTNGSGFFVMGNSGVTPPPGLVFPGNGLQNGADAVALYSGDAVAFPNGTPVTAENLIDAVVYDTDDSDNTTLLDTLTPGQPQLNEAGGGDKDNHSNQRCPDGEGGPRVTTGYSQAPATPGVTNNCEVSNVEIGLCYDNAETLIHAVQGNGASSPLVGEVVVVEGVVVGDFQASDELGGYFVQEEDSDVDGDPATSEGIYIFDFTSDVSVGDVVRVLGPVQERFGETQITGQESALCASAVGGATASSVTLPVPDVPYMERFEGMLLTFPDTLTATDTFNVHRFGEVVVSANGRQFNPTDLILPGPDAADLNGNSIADINEPGRLLVDDGSSAQFPDTVPYLAGDNTLRLGDTVTGLTGTLGYGFNFYRLQPTQAVTFERANPRPGAAADVGGTIKVATFNVLNYWTTIDDGNNNARGADSDAEFTRQISKTVSAILDMGVDVIGLQELENNGTGAIGSLVDELNAVAGPSTWAAIPDPAYPGGIEATNAIKVGIIYQPGRLTPVGPGIWDDDAAFATDRPPLAHTFSANDGEVFTFVSNHFKSKGCRDSQGLDQDQNDGQACYNARRSAQATALLDFVTTLQALSADEDVVVVGDMNAYAKEDPITILNGGLVNQVERYYADRASEKYTFTFFGQSGSLDYIFSTGSLAERFRGADIWHINTDEPRVIDYNDDIIDPGERSSDYRQPGLYTPDQYRASDHDPIVAGFCDAVAPVVSVQMTPDTLWPANHKYVAVQAQITVDDPQATISLVSAASNEPDNGTGDGDTANDLVQIDDYSFDVRAERAGGGEGRTYSFTYRAVDICGNAAEATGNVFVPHDNGKATDTESNSESSERESGSADGAGLDEHKVDVFLPFVVR
jgi:predicted extracellular nuclease